MTSSDDEQRPDEGRSPIEERFLDGYDDGEPDEFDEELIDLVETRERGSVLRPILMIAVVVLVGWVIYDWADHLAYFASSPDPVEVGDVAQFDQKAAEDPDWEPPLEHNTYVSMEGMPTRITSGGNHEFFRLIGAEIYVQRQVDGEDGDDDDSIIDDDGALPERELGDGLSVDEHRTRYEGAGRLVSFSADPERVEGLKEFYGDQYSIRFCEDYTDRQLEDLRRQQREVIEDNWRERYREADPEEREERGLTAEPDEDEVQQLLDRRPVCVNAYLLQDGERPVDQWWYVLFSVLLGAFMLFNVYKLVRWFQTWLEP